MIHHPKAAPDDIEPLIVADLVAAGYDLTKVGSLRQNYTTYREAIPVLVRWLPLAHDYNLKETIFRALAVPAAKKEALETVIDQFANLDNTVDPSGWRLRWAAGNTLEVLWNDHYFDQLRSLCEDRSYGRAREMVVRGMAKSKDPQAGPTLIGLLEDPDVLVPAVIALRKVRPQGAREALERVEDAQEPWVQKEIQKTLSKLPD